MTPEQITSISREYAEEKTDSISFTAYADPEFKKEVCTKGYANEAKEVIEFLLQRYCLVEKSKVSEEHKSAKHDSKMAHRERQYTMLAVASARKALLESLFPEIAKEVEDA